LIQDAFNAITEGKWGDLADHLTNDPYFEILNLELILPRQFVQQHLDDRDPKIISMVDVNDNNVGNLSRINFIKPQLRKYDSLIISMELMKLS